MQPESAQPHFAYYFHIIFILFSYFFHIIFILFSYFFHILEGRVGPGENIDFSKEVVIFHEIT